MANDPAARVLAAGVRLYQLTLRGVIGAHCRFEPSCSHYAIAALREHGAFHGSALAAKRVLRCNPWHPGGYDPVPQAASRLQCDMPVDHKERTAP